MTKQEKMVHDKLEEFYLKLNCLKRDYKHLSYRNATIVSIAFLIFLAWNIYLTASNSNLTDTVVDQTMSMDINTKTFEEIHDCMVNDPDYTRNYFCPHSGKKLDEYECKRLKCSQ